VLNRIRSVSVVLPASTWAMMPMFRSLRVMVSSHNRMSSPPCLGHKRTTETSRTDRPRAHGRTARKPSRQNAARRWIGRRSDQGGERLQGMAGKTAKPLRGRREIRFMTDVTTGLAGLPLLAIVRHD
jgi:hypothetical protein